MSRDIENITKEIIKANKEIHQMEDKFSKDMNDLKKLIKNLDKKVDLVLNKIQEFEVIMDAAELIEEQMEEEEEEDKYNTEWSPYEDEDYDGESYDNYNNEEEDE
jgi:peptidoglycan hydrolase CwlO-like protein